MAEEAKPTTGGAVRMVAIDGMVENIRYKAQILARTNKVDSAVMGSGLVGFAAGLVFALVFILLPVMVL
ncbi:MAG: tetrahydromethanopterin S-methyltransferase subunit F [Methanomicrobiales archaeon]|jgi:tetrahydromethanopterin S-methyltransferase subunit F|nr:tetrahydromethanopterin S-methyltransferase subunit F [Methanomicrobiales archaeon]